MLLPRVPRVERTCVYCVEGALVCEPWIVFAVRQSTAVAATANARTRFLIGDVPVFALPGPTPAPSVSTVVSAKPAALAPLIVQILCEGRHVAVHAAGETFAETHFRFYHDLADVMGARTTTVTASFICITKHEWRGIISGDLGSASELEGPSPFIRGDGPFGFLETFQFPFMSAPARIPSSTSSPRRCVGGFIPRILWRGRSCGGDNPWRWRRR